MSQSKSYPVSIVPPFSAVRLGDISSGHYPWPPRVNDSASPNVFVNGLGWHRVGDHWVTHCCPPPPPPAPPAQCHDGILVHGAPGVYVNGQPAGRIGDLISCSPHNEFADQGSPNVFCGNFVGAEYDPTTPGTKAPTIMGGQDEATIGDNVEVSRPDYATWDRGPFSWVDVERTYRQI